MYGLFKAFRELRILHTIVRNGDISKRVNRINTPCSRDGVVIECSAQIEAKSNQEFQSLNDFDALLCNHMMDCRTTLTVVAL